MHPELEALRKTLTEDRPTNIGFPGATDIDYAELAPFLGHLLNNVGDPYADGVGRAHTRDLEREVVEFLADLLRAPGDDRWGYVTSGGTEGNECGLYLARVRHPRGVVYYSAAAHYSVPKVAQRLRMPAVAVPAGASGEMSYVDLARVVQPGRPAIVVATAGTTMTEAVDDVGRIRSTLDGTVHVHVDAALAGVPLALLEPGSRPAFDLAEGADSVAVSGHKFLGVPFPCGVLVTRRSLRSPVGRPVDYIGAPDATIAGSRSGHAPLFLWYALRQHGRDGLHRRAEESRALAAYTVTRLREAGVPAWRHPHAFTVVLPTPAPSILDRWALASSGGISHLVCVPGVRRAWIDTFIQALR